MSIETLEARVQDLEMELGDIKAELERIETHTRPKSREHLYGILKGMPVFLRKPPS